MNFEAALTRHAMAIDTVDYGVDIVIDESGAWEVKDTEDLSANVEAGRMTETESAEV